MQRLFAARFEPRAVGDNAMLNFIQESANENKKN